MEAGGSSHVDLSLKSYVASPTVEVEMFVEKMLRHSLSQNKRKLKAAHVTPVCTVSWHCVYVRWNCFEIEIGPPKSACCFLVWILRLPRRTRKSLPPTSSIYSAAARERCCKFPRICKPLGWSGAKPHGAWSKCGMPKALSQYR